VKFGHFCRRQADLHRCGTITLQSVLAYVNMGLRLHMRTNPWSHSIALLELLTWPSQWAGTAVIHKSGQMCIYTLWGGSITPDSTMRPTPYPLNKQTVKTLLTLTYSLVWHVSQPVLLKTVLPGFTLLFISRSYSNISFCSKP